MTSPTRVSQRAPRSCRRCAIMKLKCDKNIPCRTCVQRGQADTCHREVVVLTNRAQARRDERREQRLRETTQRVQAQQDGTNISDRATLNRPNDSGHREPLPSHSSLPTTSTSDEQMPSRGLATDAATSLESVAWNSHPAMNQMSLANILGDTTAEVSHAISLEQARQVANFFYEHVAWMQNVIHVPTCKKQFEAYQDFQSIQGTPWAALNLAILSSGLYHMSEHRRQALGFHDGISLSKKVYGKTLETLQEVDYMAIHSIFNLQAICVILPCAHGFGDAKRIMVMLSTAICIAQVMRLHRLGPETCMSSSIDKLVEREIKKRVWCFLSTQDSYLTTFKFAYSIMSEQSNTPSPANCRDEDGQMIRDNRILDLPLSTPTQSSYMILLHRLANISKSLFDKVCLLEKNKAQLTEVFDAVSQADEEILRLEKTLPEWLQPDSHDDRSYPANVRFQRFVFGISVAHKRLTIHRTFFCRSLRDKKYYYSHMSCLSSARRILKDYATISQEEPPTLHWTTPPHVISASIVIMLHILFFDDDCGYGENDRNLLDTCFELLDRLDLRSSIVTRGLKIIRRLLEQGTNREYFSLNDEEVARLIQEIEHIMAGELEQPELLPDSQLYDTNFFNFFDLYPMDYVPADSLPPFNSLVAPR